MMLPSWSKLSLFSFGGDLLHTVFGTATDKQVQKLNTKILAIEQWAKVKGTLLQKSVQRINDNSHKIILLNRDIEALANIINSNSLEFNIVKVNQLFLSIGSYLGYLIESYDVIINSLVLAGNNVVSPHLLPPSELQDVLEVAKTQHRFEPLYDFNNLDKYYSVLRVKIVDGLV